MTGFPGVYGATILTNSGFYFDFTRPEASVFTEVDIAAGLSKTCRFGGQCREFYSVAQHSILVASMVPPEDRFTALMHDAAEAFVGDIPSPLKALLPDFKIIEKRVEAVIAERFGLMFPFPPSVKHADLRALKTEREDLMPPARDAIEWPGMDAYERHPDRINPWRPEDAARNWLAMFDHLNAARRAA